MTTAGERRSSTVSHDNLTGFLLARTCSGDGCDRSGKLTRGMCAKHYRAWIDHTPPERRPIAPRFAREFDDFIDRSGGCWIWTGVTNAGGYGWWSNRGERGLAHRIALARVTPPPDPALLACHRCDNPPCVRPDHLYWGSAKDNARDLVERHGIHNAGVYATHCPRGHEMAGANLRLAGLRQKRFCRTCDNARSRERQRRLRKASRGAH